ncbi:hypothetical protein FJ366_01160 [Candidatus Dependentiae bacterium]|nr:hypothetical protein [Candidatus Dependentiae bacterium]
MFKATNLLFILAATTITILDAPKTPPPTTSTEDSSERPEPPILKPLPADYHPSPSQSSVSTHGAGSSAEPTPQEESLRKLRTHTTESKLDDDDTVDRYDRPPLPPRPPLHPKPTRARRHGIYHQETPPEFLELQASQQSLEETLERSSTLDEFCDIYYPEADAYYERHRGWPDILIGKYRKIEYEITALKTALSDEAETTDPERTTTRIKNLINYNKRILVFLAPFERGKEHATNAFHVLRSKKNPRMLLEFQKHNLAKIEELKKIVADIDESEKRASETFCATYKHPLKQELVFWCSCAFFFEHAFFENSPTKQSFSYKEAGIRITNTTHHYLWHEKLLKTCREACAHHNHFLESAEKLSAVYKKHFAMNEFWEGAYHAAQILFESEE